VREGWRERRGGPAEIRHFLPHWICAALQPRFRVCALEREREREREREGDRERASERECVREGGG